MRRACARPSVPVHAFAQPLLTTTALATPPVFSRCSFETVTGAACARFTVNSAAAEAGASAARTARSSADAEALMPECTAADLNPAGAVTPPSAGDTVNPVVERMTSAMKCRQRHERARAAAEGPHHRVLAALPEVHAGVAIRDDLLG